MGFAQLPLRAKLYWGLIVCAGAWFSLTSVASGGLLRQDTGRIALYVFAAIVASGLKIRVPGTLVTLSMNYVVIIATLLSLNLTAGIVVGTVSALGQCLIYAKQKP